MARHEHPWWKHLPSDERLKRQRQLEWLRWKGWLRARKQVFLIAALVYLLFCGVPLLIGQAHLSLIALLPVILIPPVGYLVYLLAWHEYHR